MLSLEIQKYHTIVVDTILIEDIFPILLLEKLPVKSIWTANYGTVPYLDFKREFENIFNIYFSYMYQSDLSVT